MCEVSEEPKTAGSIAGRAGTVRPVCIVGTGSYLPERVVTNADIEKMVDTSDEWIRTRTGIRERRIARDDQAASDLGVEASRLALDQAGLDAGRLDAIIAATMSPDMIMPNTACFIQTALGAGRAACFGLEAACSGFTYGLEVGTQLVAGGGMDAVLVVGTEKLSSFVDWTDRATCILFGDGAGAAVLRPSKQGHRMVGSVLHANGKLAGLLHIPAGGSRQPASESTLKAGLHLMKMGGRDVFKHAVIEMTKVVHEALGKCGLSVDDVNWIIPHQANIRIIQAVADRLGTPLDRWFLNIERYGNMSAASVAVALDEAARSGRLKTGEIVVLVVFGGGFTWGATVIEW